MYSSGVRWYSVSPTATSLMTEAAPGRRLGQSSVIDVLVPSCGVTFWVTVMFGVIVPA